MDSVFRNVTDLSPDERHVYEGVLGQVLRDDQGVLVQLVNGDSGEAASQPANDADEALKPYQIWAELEDTDIAELEAAILHRSDSRST